MAMWKGKTEGIYDIVNEAILATKHIDPPKSDLAKTLCDLDLSAMIYPDLYKENVIKIRKEWMHLSDEEYLKGRAEWLDGGC